VETTEKPTFGASLPFVPFIFYVVFISVCNSVSWMLLLYRC